MKTTTLRFFSLLPVLGAAAFLTGCLAQKKSSEDKIREYTDIQSQVETRNAVDAENGNRKKWSSEMEKDLQRRQRFYQSLAGIYEGAFKINGTDFNVRITMVPSIPPYVPGDRVRLPEEVASDLNNLYLNVQVVQWNPQNSIGSVGCLFENVRPDINRGKLSLSSEGCPSLYLLSVAEDADEGARGPTRSDAATRTASRIIEGKLDRVPYVKARMQPTTNAAVYGFSTARVEE